MPPALGRTDQHVTRDELLVHVEALAAAVDIPVSVDAERCFADDPAGVARPFGSSPRPGRLDARSRTTIRDPARSTRSRSRSNEWGQLPRRPGSAALVLTARAENHLYDLGDLDDTITRLRAYRDAGADVLYAPGS